MQDKLRGQYHRRRKGSAGYLQIRQDFNSASVPTDEASVFKRCCDSEIVALLPALRVVLCTKIKTASFKCYELYAVIHHRNHHNLIRVETLLLYRKFLGPPPFDAFESDFLSHIYRLNNTDRY